MMYIVIEVLDGKANVISQPDTKKETQEFLKAYKQMQPKSKATYQIVEVK